MPLQVADGLASYVNHGPDVLPNPQQGTIIVWLQLLSTTNSNGRSLYKKDGANATGDGSIFTNGNNLRFVRQRASGNQVVEIANANLRTYPQCLVFTFNLSGAPATYVGDLRTPLVVATSNASNGGGAGDDESAADATVMGEHNGATDSLACTVFRVYCFDTVLSLADLRRQQFMLPPVHRSIHLAAEYGADGTGLVRDLSGRGNHGTIIGSITPTNDRLPRWMGRRTVA